MAAFTRISSGSERSSSCGSSWVSRIGTAFSGEAACFALLSPLADKGEVDLVAFFRALVLGVGMLSQFEPD